MTTSKGQKRGAKALASVPHRPKLLEWLKDPRNAVAYVEAVLDEGNSKGLMQALRNVAEAQGGSALWQGRPLPSIWIAMTTRRCGWQS
jgi:hypothetical protein